MGVLRNGGGGGRRFRGCFLGGSGGGDREELFEGWGRTSTSDDHGTKAASSIAVS